MTSATAAWSGPDLDAAHEILANRVPLYSRRVPRYQLQMIEDIAAVWAGPHTSLLDLGGGTGLMAQAIRAALPVGRITCIDVEDRFYDDLDCDCLTYDGSSLPFAASMFEAASINNVVHHIPTAGRVQVFRELRRVVQGPVYIKDHRVRSPLDRPRLSILDAIGNIPFGGMVQASYLTDADWSDLASAAGYRIAARAGGRYRTGPMAFLFPNEIETVMRFDPV